MLFRSFSRAFRGGARPFSGRDPGAAAAFSGGLPAVGNRHPDAQGRGGGSHRQTAGYGEDSREPALSHAGDRGPSASGPDHGPAGRERDVAKHFASLSEGARP